jgi:hypothetical protein
MQPVHDTAISPIVNKELNILSLTKEAKIVYPRNRTFRIRSSDLTSIHYDCRVHRRIRSWAVVSVSRRCEQWEV